MQKFYTLQDSNIIYLPQEGLTGTRRAYDKYENLGFDQDQHLLLRNYVGETQYGEMTGVTRTEIVGIVDNAWVRKHYWNRPFYYGRPVVWKNDEMDAIDFLQKESDQKAKEQREKLRKDGKISLKLDHWNGANFRIYDCFTKKTIGYLIDDIDWRFIDKQGVEHKMPASYDKFSVDQAINYFTSKDFIKTLS